MNGQAWGRADRVAQAALALTVIAAFLAASPRVASFYFLPKLALLAACSCAAWAALAAGARGPRRTRLDAPLVALFAAVCWSLARSPDPAPGILGDYPLHVHGLLSCAVYAALFYAAAACARTLPPEPILRAVLLGGAALSAYGLLQRGGVELIGGLPAELPHGRITSLQGNPVFLGSCLVLVIPVALWALGRSGFDRALGAAALALGIPALGLTVSRAAWLGALAAVCAERLASGRLDPAPRHRAWALGALLAAALLLLPAAAALRPTGVSDSGRVELWRSSLRAAAERPWSGAGPDGLRVALGRLATDGFVRTHGRAHTQSGAHNDLLQALATLGAGGLLAYLWVLWGLLAQCRAAVSDPRRGGAAAALAGGLAGLFVQAKLNAVPLSALAVASVYAGILAATGDDAPDAEAARRPGRARLLDAAAALGCAALAALACRLVLADASQARAARLEASGRYEAALTEYARATRLNPWEPFYWRARAQALFTLAKRSGDPEARQRLMEEAARLGEQAAARRPARATGWHIRGTALGMLRVYGGPDRLEEAARALDHALEREHSSPGILENRIQVARLKGEQGRARELERELARLQRLADFP